MIYRNWISRDWNWDIIFSYPIPSLLPSIVRATLTAAEKRSRAVPLNDGPQKDSLITAEETWDHQEGRWYKAIRRPSSPCCCGSISQFVFLLLASISHLSHRPPASVRLPITKWWQSSLQMIAFESLCNIGCWLDDEDAPGWLCYDDETKAALITKRIARMGEWLHHTVASPRTMKRKNR